jgi:hypothetical protein
MVQPLFGPGSYVAFGCRAGSEPGASSLGRGGLVNVEYPSNKWRVAMSGKGTPKVTRRFSVYQPSLSRSLFYVHLSLYKHTVLPCIFTTVDTYGLADL